MIDTPVVTGRGMLKSTYEIVQHKYIGGGHPGCGGWIEVLEVKNPPSGKCGLLIYEYWSHAQSHESFFWEWKSLKDAITAYESSAGWGELQRPRFAASPGFIRFIDCQDRTPWFYAKEETALDCAPLPGELF